MSHCVLSYINTVRLKTVCCFPNNKPGVTKDIKALLNEKNRAFRSGDKEAVKEVQGQLSVKLEELRLQKNNHREAWRGMNTITGFKPNSRETDGDAERANKFNLFF